MNTSIQSIVDVLSEQRNAAMNAAAQAEAGLRTAIGENERLTKELDDAKKRIAELEPPPCEQQVPKE